MSVTNNQQNPVVSSQDVAQRASPGGKTCEPIFERLDAATVTVLTRLARAQQAGLHALLLTVLGAEARRRNGRSTLIIGSGISVRPAEADTATGYVVNLLPLVLNDDNGLTLGAQICAAQATWTEAIEHDGHPSHAQISLFDISLTRNPARNCADVLAHPATGIDLAFSYEAVEDNGGDLELSLAWNPDVFNRNTAEAWLRSFAIWARWLAEDVGRADAPLPALLPDEALCLARWERGPVRMRPAQRFHELFEGVADRQPHRPAVVTDAGIESYAELEHQANRIARMLLDHGVAREEPVAVLTECSARLAATVLGIWKAGGAYLPLVLEQPPERLAYMARDGGQDY